MKLGIKIATLVFFISGLVFFVGYQSGYFFPSETESNEPTEPDARSISEPDSNQDTLQAGNKDSVVVDSASKIVKTNPVKPTPKTVTLKELDQEKIRMYSSKSAIVEPFPSDEKYRMGSSKSIRGRRSYTGIFQSNMNQPLSKKQDTSLLNNATLDSIRIFDTLR